MELRPRYPHWLSYEYTLADTWGGSPHPSTLALAGEGLLKLHALFGANLAISDIHMIDSPALLRAFRRDEFRDFLRTEPDFLSLVARRSTEAWARGNDAVCATALERARVPGWYMAGGPGVLTASVVALAGAVLKVAAKEHSLAFALRSPAVAAIRRKYEKYPDVSEHLEGVLHSLEHFAATPGANVTTPDPGNEPWYLDTVLELALGQSELSADAEQCYEKTLLFIKQRIPDPEERHRQSVVFAELKRSVPRGSVERRMIRNTTHHAWNRAVQHTVVGNGGGSFGDLPDSVPVGLHVPGERLSDLVVPIRTRTEFGYEAPRLVARTLFTAPWDPTDQSWSSIRKAVEAARVERQDYRTALASNDEYAIATTLEALIAKLTAHFAPSPPPAHPMLWQAALAAAGGFLAVWFGAPELAPKTASGAGAMFYFGRLGLQHQVHFAIGQTLHEAADAFIRPTGERARR